MIGAENINLTGSINPDKQAISTKTTIDISLKESDILLSGESVKTDLTATQIIVQRTSYIDNIFEEDFNPLNLPDISYYYVPVYNEKISYETWKKRINKTFQELELR